MADLFQGAALPDVTTTVQKQDTAPEFYTNYLQDIANLGQSAVQQGGDAAGHAGLDEHAVVGRRDLLVHQEVASSDGCGQRVAVVVDDCLASLAWSLAGGQHGILGEGARPQRPAVADREVVPGVVLVEQALDLGVILCRDARGRRAHALPHRTADGRHRGSEAKDEYLEVGDIVPREPDPILLVARRHQDASELADTHEGA